MSGKTGFWSNVNPNSITWTRIVLTTILDILLLINNFWTLLISLPLYTIVAVSDKLDGWVARKYNKTSLFGEMLDRVADKLFICSNLIILTYGLYCQGYLTWYLYGLGAFITIVIEIILFANAVKGYRTKKTGGQAQVAAGINGKAKMGIQIGVTAAAVLSLFLFKLDYQITDSIANGLMSLAIIAYIPGIFFGIESIKSHRQKKSSL